MVRLPALITALAAVLALAALTAGCGRSASEEGGEEVVLNDLDRLPASARASRGASAGGTAVAVVGPGEDADAAAALVERLPASPGERRADPADDAPSPGAPTDADVEAEVAQLKKHGGRRARITPDGQAVAPSGAPPAVQRIIAAGNIISRSPYKWGGGHGDWLDDGYDCSGSVSFALAAAGLLDAPLVSGALAEWGSNGRGRWVTVYANDGHVWMNVAGLRFDTSGRDSRNGGSRWQPRLRPESGYAIRHPAGL